MLRWAETSISFPKIHSSRPVYTLMKKTSTADIGQTPNYSEIVVGPADIRSILASNNSSQRVQVSLKISRPPSDGAEILFSLAPHKSLAIPKDMVMFLESGDVLEAMSNGDVHVTCSYMTENYEFLSTEDGFEIATESGDFLVI